MSARHAGTAAGGGGGGGRPRPDLGPLYAIADAEALAPLPVPSAVAAMAAAGVRTIQLRAKRWSGRQWYEGVAASCRALAGSRAALWLDDRADLAALFAASGVRGLHLGQRDLPPGAARPVVGDSLWIGMSTHNERQLAAADADPEVDLIAVGPVFPTTGKVPAPPDPAVGLDFIRWARARTAKPLVAIGGIDAERLAAVLAAGADAAVALGAVCRGDVRENCLRLLAAAASPGGGQERCTSF
jgi:thiamine-phosphate pyrophosphorylase